MADGLIAISSDSSFKDMKKAGKRLFAALGGLRDVQVMAEWVQKLGLPGDPETRALLDLLARRENEQKALAGEAIRAFDTRQWRKWSRELPRKAAILKRGSLAFKHVALERWTEAHELHRRALRNRSQGSWHQLRIGIKRFRYVVENFLPQQHEAWSTDLKDLQDLLGDIHDLDVLWATAIQVNAFAGEESRTKWHTIVRDAREKRLTRYRERMVGPHSLWRVWRAGLPVGEQVEAASMARLRLWASFLDPDFQHSERVTNLAGQLFDAFSGLRLFPATAEHDARRILIAAALTHDVGRAKGSKGHHKRSFRRIQQMTPPLGWTVPELQLVAVVARFHRGALPHPRHKALLHLAAPDKKLAVYLAGILRLANAFQGKKGGTLEVRDVQLHEGSLEISASGYAPWSAAARRVSASRHMLEVLLHKPILVKAIRASQARARQPQLATRNAAA
jgi:exopolyphosphatase/guanosine-5'-triphosphate,3'-diphosphate pyrophosphatase